MAFHPGSPSGLLARAIPANPTLDALVGWKQSIYVEPLDQTQQRANCSLFFTFVIK